MQGAKGEGQRQAMHARGNNTTIVMLMAVIASVVLMVVAALAAPFVQRDVIMVGAALPAYAPMSRTNVSNAFMSAVNKREIWMWDPWSGDNVAGENDVELDGWNPVPARRSPYGTRVRAPAARAKRRWAAPMIVWNRAAATPNASLAPVMVRWAPADQKAAELALILLEALDTPLCKMLPEGAAVP